MDDTICYVCGNEIENSGKQKTGRPVQFHRECNDVNKAISLLQNRLETFKRMNPCAENKKRIRSALWSLANGMNGK